MLEVIPWVAVSVAIWFVLIVTGLFNIFTAPLAPLMGDNQGIVDGHH